MKISVIIPVFNRKTDLQRCLDSITIPDDDCEIIVVDDASVDGSFEFAAAYPNSYVKTFKNLQNRGVNYTRNRGVEYATGDYIVFLDSDDTFLPNALHVIKKQIESDGQSHYLFLIKGKNEKKSSEPYLTSYRDWITEEVYGDFVHVVRKSTLLKYPFLEQFRAYENLNWLRIFKETAPQKVVPEFITWADQDRTDNLTKTLTLKTTNAIDDKFEYMCTFFKLYGNDLFNAAPQLYKSKLRHSVLLGIAAFKKSKAMELITFAPTKTKIGLKALVLIIPSFLLNKLVIAKAGR